jgi:hypothetical protein
LIVNGIFLTTIGENVIKKKRLLSIAGIPGE